jgi:hypothetical protein
VGGEGGRREVDGKNNIQYIICMYRNVMRAGSVA